MLPPRSFSRLVCSLVVLYLSILPSVLSWLATDVPENNKNRTLTRVSIPRTYSLDQQEVKSMNSDEVESLQGSDYNVMAFTSTGVKESSVKRAVIVLHGQGRDAWSYFDQAMEALYNATRSTSNHNRKKRTKLKRFETLIFAPMFLNDADEGLYDNMNDLQFDSVSDMDSYDGSAAETSLAWQKDEWANGGDSIQPASISSVGRSSQSYAAPSLSSFEVLDYIVSQFSNKTMYPKMETIIVAGHSMGSQAVQRYALIGRVPSSTVPVHFVIANPGSFAYLTPARPNTTEDCQSTYDEWKYGLNSYGQRYLSDFVRESLDSENDLTDVRVRYLRDRQTHYLFGLADHGEGDTRCEAMAQGNTHLTRGRNYMEHVKSVAKSTHVKIAHSVDYIKGVSHDPLGMFTSKRGIERLFFTNVEGEEEPQGVGDADQDSAYYPVYPSPYSLSPASRPSVSLGSVLLLSSLAFPLVVFFTLI